MVKLGPITEAWTTFTPSERRNIGFYILGIMLYKFGLEAFNGSISSLMTNRYDYDAWAADVPAKTFQQINLATGLNAAFQCVGSILIAPLIKRFPTKNVLSTAVLIFGLFTAILLIVDAATGGTMPPVEFRPPNKHPTDDGDYWYYGNFNTDGIIPIYCVCGVAYGMVELIRRVIPRDIVGGNVQKLRKMDSIVHIFYEVAGTSGSFCTALALIPNLGANRSFMITPILFALVASSWFMVGTLNFKPQHGDTFSKQPSYVKLVLGGFYYFFESAWVGAKIIFSSFKFFWLLPGYAIALYGHRYLENGVAPIIARRYLGESAWSQIMVGGSNLGELLGALVVFLFTNLVQTPIPYLRLDALLLLIVWYLPYWRPQRGQVSQAWRVAGTFIPISFGWAAGDVSLAAYIQASLARMEATSKDISPLGAVMAFLYCTYIVLYAILGTLLGRYVDQVFNSTGQVFSAVQNVAGVHFTVICVVVFSATFIPRGSFALNPKMLYDQKLDVDVADDETAINAPYEGALEKDGVEKKESDEVVKPTIVP